MKKSRIVLIICIIALLVLVCSGGGLVYQHLTAYPPMCGLHMAESEQIIYSDEPYTTVVLTEEIHKENPELAILIEKMDKSGFDRELRMTNDILSLVLYPDQYISVERGSELWNAYGYAGLPGKTKEEQIVLYENGKLYCLLKTCL